MTVHFCELGKTLFYIETEKHGHVYLVTLQTSWKIGYPPKKATCEPAAGDECEVLLPEAGLLVQEHAQLLLDVTEPLLLVNQNILDVLFLTQNFVYFSMALVCR